MKYFSSVWDKFKILISSCPSVSFDRVFSRIALTSRGTLFLTGKRNCFRFCWWRGLNTKYAIKIMWLARVFEIRCSVIYMWGQILVVPVVELPIQCFGLQIWINRLPESSSRRQDVYRGLQLVLRRKNVWKISFESGGNLSISIYVTFLGRYLMQIKYSLFYRFLPFPLNYNSRCRGRI